MTFCCLPIRQAGKKLQCIVLWLYNKITINKTYQMIILSDQPSLHLTGQLPQLSISVYDIANNTNPEVKPLA